MAELVLFHHAQGLTSGLLGFAEELRAAGHVVHAPDLYEGKTFDSIDEGVANAKAVGFGNILERGKAAVQSLPHEIVYAGFSLGVMPAQMLTQTRTGAKGALLFSSCLPPAEFDGEWPKGVPAQIHMMEQDEWILEGDLDAARAMAESIDGVALFLYPGDKHLFADDSLPDYDESAATKLGKRVLQFLAKID